MRLELPTVASSVRPSDDNICAFLQASLEPIVLAGGDVRLGWHTFEKTGMKDVIVGRYAHGAVLLGVLRPGRSSSDAMHPCRSTNLDSLTTELLEMF